ncbi:MAG: methionine synthase [Oscillospiraceae bacterium]
MQPRLTGLNHREALFYLGCKGGPVTSDMEADMARCEALLLQTARPRIVWRRFPLLPDGSLAGTDFRPLGEDVKMLLHGCEAVILFAATLGAEAEALIRRTQVTDMADAVILDACASAAIENVCDNLCDDFAAAEAPLYLTDRFSPGYGDLPFAQQPDFCRLLDVGRRIGVTLSPGGLMIPQKTVTALLGVSPVPVKKRSRGCLDCDLFSTCSYRKEGASCGKN